MFGAFDYTNDKMHVHCYRNKTGKQFVDFLKKVNKRYDKNIQNIFVVLDNLSAHKSKMAKKGRNVQMLSTNKICISAGKIYRNSI